MVQSWLASHRRSLFAGSAGAFAFALLIATWVARRGELPFEQRAISGLFRAAERDATAHDIAVSVIGLGAGPVVLITIVAMTLIAYRELGASWAAVVPATLAAPALALALKAAGEPTRVFIEAVAPWKGEAVSSLPSAHSAYGVATFGVAAVMALVRSRRELALLCCILGSGIGVAMLTTGAHVPSDVLAGDAIGAGTALLLLALRETIVRDRRVSAGGPSSREVSDVVEAAQQPAPVGEYH
jgi:membrane-associated phospholipid phosphatase